MLVRHELQVCNCLRRAVHGCAGHGPSLKGKGAGDMPSIPQSLLWISLVVLWLFVLVPMLINKREAVRRTSDVALATRVVNTGRKARLLRRRGPAAGHRSDPDWKPSEDDVDETRRGTGQARAVVVAAAAREASSPTPSPTISMWTSLRKTPAHCRSASPPRRPLRKPKRNGRGSRRAAVGSRGPGRDCRCRRAAKTPWNPSRTAPPTSTSSSTIPRAWKHRPRPICSWQIR